MKNLLKLFLVTLAVSTIFASCSGSKAPSSARHNHGVNNRHFQGY